MLASLIDGFVDRREFTDPTTVTIIDRSGGHVREPRNGFFSEWELVVIVTKAIESSETTVTPLKARDATGHFGANRSKMEKIVEKKFCVFSGALSRGSRRRFQN